MLNLKPIRFERNGETRFGIAIELSDLSEADWSYDGLKVWFYSSDLMYAIHEIGSESEYYTVLTKILGEWCGHITATNSNAPESMNYFGLATRISEWLTNEGYRLV